MPSFSLLEGVDGGWIAPKAGVEEEFDDAPKGLNVGEENGLIAELSFGDWSAPTFLVDTRKKEDPGVFFGLELSSEEVLLAVSSSVRLTTFGRCDFLHLSRACLKGSIDSRVVDAIVFVIVDLQYLDG